ncbi:MAG: hypothetical protein ABJE66_08845 [Deltaproteobacteria bacterium]
MIGARSAAASPDDALPTVPRAPPADPVPQSPERVSIDEATPYAPGEAPPPLRTRTYGEWAAPTARAERPGRYSYAWNDPTLQSGIGLGVAAGGGVLGFTDRTMRDTMTNNVTGIWGVRATIGSQVPLGLDIDYLGSAGHINTITGAPNGTLVGTTVEVALRYNILPHNLFTPYVFAGMGWQRYSVWNVQFAQSDTGLRSHDDVAEFPTGVGITMHDPSGAMADIRGTFRTTTGSDLLADPATGTFASLYSWEATGSLGYEF